jgi:pimeloyl-ACP methyl ester carboxylesterase
MPAELILLHGALGASGQLVPLAGQLREHFTVRMLDFEGHGSADVTTRPFRMRNFADNVLDLLDARGIARAHCFGYSMGGYVALCLAHTHPDRVSSVATLGTRFRWDAATAAREASRLDPAAIRAKVPKFADALAARHASAGGWELVLERTAEMLRDLGDHPVLTDDGLARIAQPVRVIVGDRDNTVSVEESTAVARILPHGAATVMPDTPHPIEQVDVAALARLLLEFLPQVT